MENERQFDKLGVMVDCSRNSVMNVASLKKLIDMLAAMGYNTMQLYTEDTFGVEGEPYFGYLRGRYSKAEMKEIDAYAAVKGIELIPCVQTLAHLNQIFRWREYSQIRDCNDILLADEERTYALIDNIFSTLVECFTSRRVNIGMDEAHMLGLGKYLDKHGYKDRPGIMLGHLEKVLKIAGKHGFRCMMWSDMFFRLAFGVYTHETDVKVVDEIPENIRRRVPTNIDLVYWDYYHTDENDYQAMIKRHKSFGNNIIFAGGAWTWCGLAPLNRYGIAVTRAAFAACRSQGIREAFVTMWGDNGGSCSPFSVLPVLFTAAELAGGNNDESEIKRKFEAFTGVPFDEFMYADLPNVLNDNQPLKPLNPSKYLFYNDCLLGIFDTTIERGTGEIYRSHADKLKHAEKNTEWAYLFKPLRLLCEVLYYKADLGVRTREAYLTGDKAALTALLDTAYRPLGIKIKEFYKAFAAYWDTLYKPHGFDVMDLRIGGVLLRIEHVEEKLSDYVSGKADKIEELDEELLDFFGGGKTLKKQGLCNNQFASAATVNVL